MGNYQLDILELQKISFSEKLNYYFNSVKEIESLHFYKFFSYNRQERNININLTAYVKYGENSYIWTQNGVSSVQEEIKESQRLLSQISNVNFNIDYYLDNNGQHLYFNNLKKELVENYDVNIFQKEKINFYRKSLNSNIQDFIGKTTLSKIDSIKLNSLLGSKNIKDGFLKI